MVKIYKLQFTIFYHSYNHETTK